MHISEFELNRKQHKLLSLISNRVVNYETTQVGLPAVPFEEIYDVMKCDRKELTFISSKLFEENECDLYDVRGIQGLFCTPKGTTAYITKKYLKENERIITEKVKNYTAIMVAFIAILSAIYTSVKSITVEKSNKEKIIKLQQQLHDMKQLEDTVNH